MDIEKIALYIILGVLVLALALSVFAMINQNGNNIKNTPQNYQKAVAAQNPNDICATPEGYSDDEWKEHMGHHSDQYKECL